MAVANRTNTEQLQRCINNLWQHQKKNDFCDFILTTNNTSIEHAYQNIPEHILRTIIVLMYNSKYVIDDENVIELLKLSRTWNLDILARLCMTYMDDNITINNACRFYKFALDNGDQYKSQIVNKFIREHFTGLHQSGQLSELSLKNFTTIIEHDEINVKNEDVIFSSAIQIINQQSSVEDINRCLELIRLPHMSGDFLMNVILKHPLMKEPPRDRYVSEALLYQMTKIITPDFKLPRYWGKGIYYIGMNRSLYQYICKTGNNECRKMTDLPLWVNAASTAASHKEHVVIFGAVNSKHGNNRMLLVDMTNNTKVTQLPDLPERRCQTSLLLTANDVYVVGGCNKYGTLQFSVYCLSLGSDAWQIKESIPHAVNRPLVIQHQQSIYVLGGYNKYGNFQYSVLQYSLDNDRWKRWNDIPVACASDNAGVVVHKEKIKVITTDKCLIYAVDTDSWTVKYFNTLGVVVAAFIGRGGHICAVMRNVDSYSIYYSMMIYNDVDNVWKTEQDNDWKTERDNEWYTEQDNVWKSEHEKIDHELGTWLFC